MNTLKFRVFDKRKNAYENPKDFILTADGRLMVAAEYYTIGIESTIKKVVGDYDNNIYVVEQYTGLKDKNGKKIYEGDIVAIDYRCCKECPLEKYRAIIEFGNPNGVYDWGWQMKFIGKAKPSNTDILLWIEMPDVECSIIGNIHDNPELLKGKEEK